VTTRRISFTCPRVESRASRTRAALAVYLSKHRGWVSTMQLRKAIRPALRKYPIPSVRDALESQLHHLADKGLIERAHGWVRLTRKGVKHG